MSTIWLLVTGFSLTFPVLFAKTWRLHRVLSYVMSNTLDTKYSRNRKIRSSSILFFYLIVMYIPMICWQLTSPIYFAITVDDIDMYGNPISSAGKCVLSEDGTRFATAIVTILVLSCVVGNGVCFVARWKCAIFISVPAFVSSNLVSISTIYFAGTMKV